MIKFQAFLSKSGLFRLLPTESPIYSCELASHASESRMKNHQKIPEEPEKKAPVFVVATANDVSQLPPELLRKGRFDEVFFVDLPNRKEREAIWDIQISKYGRDPRDFDLLQLARVTEGLTGSEIESVFVDALFLAFDAEREPTDLDVASVLTEFVPLSKLMAEQITGLRNWASCLPLLDHDTPVGVPVVEQITPANAVAPWVGSVARRIV